MDLEAIGAEASRLSQLAIVELVGDLAGEYDRIPESVQSILPTCAELVAKQKLMLLAGMDPSRVILPADYAAAIAVLKNIEVFGKIKVDKLLETTVDSVIMKALTLAGSLLRSLLFGK